MDQVRFSSYSAIRSADLRVNAVNGYRSARVPYVDLLCFRAKERNMRKLIVCAAAAVMAMVPTVASAQRYHPGYDREVRQEIRECRRELRRADSRREYRRERRECRREIAEARRDARRDWRRDDRRYRYGYGRDWYDYGRDRYGYGYGRDRYGYR